MPGDASRDRISLAETLALDVRLEPHDAVAVVRELCSRISDGTEPLTPGKVSIDAGGALSLDESARVAPDGLGDLLEVLLLAAKRTGTERVSGPLLLTMARACRQVDAPPFASPGALSAALERFDTADHTAAFRALFARAHAPAADRSPVPETTSPPIARVPRLAPLANATDETPGLRITQVEPDVPMREAPELFATATESTPRRRSLGLGWILTAAAVGLPAGILFALTHPLSLGSPGAPPDSRPQPVIEEPRSVAPAPTPTPTPTPPTSAPEPAPTAPSTTVPSAPTSMPPAASPPVGDAASAPAPRGTSGEVTTPPALPRVATIEDDGSRNRHVQMSPDGRRVAFDSDRDGVRGVYVAAADGKDLRRVSDDGYAAMPRWSADSRQLLFVRAEADQPEVWNVWRFDADANQLARVTSHTSGQVWGASWFPDRRRIAYGRGDQLVVLDSISTRATPYASPVRGGAVRTPAVSPDGRWVIFQVVDDGAWLLDLQDGSLARVLKDPSAEEFTWSADARQVAYHSRRTGEWRLWERDR